MDLNSLCDLHVIGRLSKIMHNFNIHYAMFYDEILFHAIKPIVFEEYNLHLKISTWSKFVDFIIFFL